MTSNQTITVELEDGQVSLERTGEGPDLILLHSLLTDRRAFQPVIGHLSARWRVNLVDLPGFGGSTPVEPTIDAQARMIGSLLAEGGYDPATTALLGNGWGAFVALGTAVNFGSAFDRLAVVGCGVAFPEPARDTFRAMIATVESQGMEGVIDTAVRRIFPQNYLDRHPDAITERADVLRSTSPAAFVAACRALVGMDYRGSVGDITNPALIVVGEQDEATPPAMARELAMILPDAELMEMDGVGHAPQLQDPAHFLETVGGFLDLDQQR